ncbi:MAG: hypothetical protein EAZ70_03530 [Runella slithyformis]|nr:MAG: hypothetical protein EAY79_03080 [Runella slithyformis]TAF03590.1 MAG: hypothetical protein EAZ80_00035 [Runella slithyformis]TAF29000.1 MAG: hypothetical protein EAZ70_03530 [Runella slithyformis]TAF46459.1 MAG: hypothetical protein EAZ63_09450 [Runella slithyformis]TAF82596.1 MAG: hypothetical protein EAZ50_03620 [Runella slithyformis]
MNNQSLTKLSELPILKHLDGGSGELKVLPPNAIAPWKRGEKSIGWFVGAGLLAGGAYIFFTYILPVLINVLTQTLAFLAVAGLLVFAVLLAPFIFKLFRRIVRGLHKMLIKIDPFAELDDQLGKMKDSREEFEKAKAEINACKIQMKQEAVKAEKLAKDAKQKVVYAQQEAESIKEKLQKATDKHGDTARETDEFVEMEGRLSAAIGDGNRSVSEAETYKRLVDTFASRANVFAKLDRKLMSYGHAFDEKIKDFATSINLLKTESRAMESANNATSRARKAIGNSQDWQLDYALEVISNQISSDIASTQANIRDLDSIVRDFNPNDERAYARLETFANQIKDGQFEVSDPNRVANPNYKLSPDQKNAGGGLTDIF